jgi:hypothetical protein
MSPNQPLEGYQIQLFKHEFFPIGEITLFQRGVGVACWQHENNVGSPRQV